MDLQSIRSDEGKISGSRLKLHRLTFWERVLLHILTRSCLRELGIKGSFPAPCSYIQVSESVETLSSMRDLAPPQVACTLIFSMILKLSRSSTVKCPSPLPPQLQSRPGSEEGANPSRNHSEAPVLQLPANRPPPETVHDLQHLPEGAIRSSNSTTMPRPSIG